MPKTILTICLAVLLLGISGCKEKNDVPQAAPAGPPPTGIAIDEANFPDGVFRAALMSTDEGSDGILTDEELVRLTTLNVEGLGITDLRGIELLSQLAFVYADGNLMTGVDLRHNQRLQAVSLAECERLRTVTLGTQRTLETLNLNHSDLRALDLSGCAQLKTLRVYNTPLATVSLRGCHELEAIECDNTLMVALDITPCPNVKFIDAYGEIIE